MPLISYFRMGALQMNIYAPEAGNHLAIHIFYYLTCLAAIVAGLTVAHDTEVIIEWRERYTTDKALAGGPYLVSHFGHCLVPLASFQPQFATVRRVTILPTISVTPSFGSQGNPPQINKCLSPACPIVRAYRISESSHNYLWIFKPRSVTPPPGTPANTSPQLLPR